MSLPAYRTQDAGREWVRHVHDGDRVLIEDVHSPGGLYDPRSSWHAHGSDERRSRGFLDFENIRVPVLT